jgi:hypothetical protein
MRPMADESAPDVLSPFGIELFARWPDMDFNRD